MSVFVIVSVLSVLSLLCGLPVETNILSQSLDDSATIVFAKLRGTESKLAVVCMIYQGRVMSFSEQRKIISTKEYVLSKQIKNVQALCGHLSYIWYVLQLAI